jgi:Transposase DDE domain group 1
MRDGRPVTVEVTSDGAGLVSHAGSALLAQVAEKVGVTGALSLRLAGLKVRRRGHDPGRVMRDLAVMLADGGECVSDLGAVRDRFQAILTDRAGEDIAVLECRDRQHAHVEDRIRDDKDTGLSKFPFKEFALNGFQPPPADPPPPTPTTTQQTPGHPAVNTAAPKPPERTPTSPRTHANAHTNEPNRPRPSH